MSEYWLHLFLQNIQSRANDDVSVVFCHFVYYNNIPVHINLILPISHTARKFSADVTVSTHFDYHFYQTRLHRSVPNRTLITGVILYTHLDPD